MRVEQENYPDVTTTQPQRDTVCFLCDSHAQIETCQAAATLRPKLASYIERAAPDRFQPNGHICQRCMDRMRMGLVAGQLEDERGELSSLEQEIARKAATHENITKNISETFNSRLTLGGRIADRVAQVGGSWNFILGFGAVLFIWILINAWALRGDGFDPYPFILLNLVLSCLAAIQAPIIMMSQNRASAHDRLQADEDFRVNLKTELEVAMLHEKLDHLLGSQWQRMMEVQEAQMELLQELRSSGNRPGN